MLYIIRGGSYVKIGYTAQDVKRRMNELQTGSPTRLRLIKTSSHATEAEAVEARDRFNRELAH